MIDQHANDFSLPYAEYAEGTIIARRGNRHVLLTNEKVYVVLVAEDGFISSITQSGHGGKFRRYDRDRCTTLYATAACAVAQLALTEKVS